MSPTAIERYFPTFTPPARRLFLVIDASLRAMIGAARRVRSRFVVRFSLRVMLVLVLVVGSGLGWVVRLRKNSAGGRRQRQTSRW